ncbi:MAG TPA: UDP-N-acetylmuramate--L-alanine ligase [Planctomycetota bacterium]|nr:UDP-N-acetylmuramate--L-alanine ligase [Planctomycetota bacterium]
MSFDGRHIHYMGIAGVGMSAIAQMTLEQGAKVSGCDAKDSDMLRLLARRGCTTYVGHDPAHLAGVELVVRSSAVAEADPEVLAAHRQLIPVISRARMLARFTADRCLVGVAGAHGKTTTTWVVSKLLLEAHLDPSVMVGGMVEELGGNYRLGASPFFVTEVDESDGSLLEFAPHYSIVTNVDHEHVDQYPDLASLQDTFRRYLARTRPGGCVVMCADSAPAMETLDAWTGDTLTYGFAESARFRAENVRTNGGSSTFDVRRPDGVLRDLVVSLPGLHNVQNALAGVALASALGIGDDALRRALGRIASVGRRLEKRGAARGVTMMDDYGHHPTEIRATLGAARGMVPGRLVAVFQPHRYTRTFHLSDRFGDCFDGLDYLVLLPIYSAGEPPLDGVSTQWIERAIRQRGHVPCACFDDWEAARRHVLGLLRPGDTLLTIGAGDVFRFGDQLLHDLQEHPQP